ncbi:MAG TPA: hypothetical protein VG204_19830 [Terriglobia bacterium]|nr:hypothetical protein [Terriglobia bacterium]
MTKTIKLEIEVTLDDSVEQRAIQVAREHYREVDQATIPVDDKGDRWREVPAEEFIPDAETAIMELIGANDLLEKAGVEVTAVSGLEPQREELRRQETLEAGLQDAARLRGQAHDGSGPGLDEFETGVYLCRWPNGDFSLVTANTRREALVELDEWAGVHPCQLFPMDSCMVDFSLNDRGEIELKQFGEETEHSIWEISYPELHALLSSVLPQDGGEHTAEARESIRQAVQRERTRLWNNQQDSPPAETEIGKVLRKRLRTVGPVAD